MLFKRTRKTYIDCGSRALLTNNLTTDIKEDIAVMRRMGEQVKEIFRIDREIASRLSYYKLIEHTARKIHHKLPFRDETLEKLGNRSAINQSMVESVIKNKELLDIFYETTVDEIYRKGKGQFLTPSRVAEFMASWGMMGGCSSVLDPAVGTGIFLDKIFDLIKKYSEYELCGVDIDPVLLNATSLRLALMGLPSDKITLLKEDFLKMNFVQKEFDLVICNPPYLNFHDFDRAIDTHAIEHRFGLKLSRLTNIYSLFFIQASSFVKKNGKMVFITPSEFFYTGYGEELKKFFINNWTIDAFILIDFSRTVFNDALTTAVITLLRKTPPPEDHKVKFIRILEWPEDNTILIKAVTEGLVDRSYYKMYQVLQNDLDPTEKWLVHFERNGYGSLIKKLVPLSKIAQVDRGIATGHNDYFALNEKEISEWKIEKHFLRPVISKASHCLGYVFTAEDYDKLRDMQEKVHLLYCFEKPSENLQRYIEYGEKIDTHKRFLTRHRKPWYSMERGKVAPILATVFSRKRMRFVFNKTECLNLTAFHGIYPNFSDITLQKALLAYLNSNRCKDIQTIMRREYGGGLHKFEPRDLEKLPVLDVTSLDRRDVEILANLFDKLCEGARSSIADEEKVKAEIDKQFKRILQI